MTYKKAPARVSDGVLIEPIARGRRRQHNTEINRLNQAELDYQIPHKNLAALERFTYHPPPKLKLHPHYLD